MRRCTFQAWDAEASKAIDIGHGLQPFVLNAREILVAESSMGQFGI